MIKITVRHSHHHHHHHHHQPHNEHPSDTEAKIHCTQANEQSSDKGKRKVANREDKSRGKRHQLSSKQLTSSSIVEIKYSRMSSSRPISSSSSSSLNPSYAPAPKAAMRSLKSVASSSNFINSSKERQHHESLNNRIGNRNNRIAHQRPRGSLSSCSSSSPDLSGNEESDHHWHLYSDQHCHLSVFDESPDEQEQQSRDMNNNHDSICATGSTPREQPTEVKQTSAPVEAARADTAPNANQQPRRNNHRLHSRSISLIVNPNFDSSSGEENDAQEANLVKYRRARNGPHRFHQRQSSQCSVTRDNFKESDFERLLELKEELEACKLLEKFQNDERLTQVESSRLREIGFFLRQVSDEFARTRHLTI